MGNNDFKALIGITYDLKQAQSELDRQIKSLQKSSKLALDIELSDKEAKKVIQDSSKMWSNYRKEAIASSTTSSTELKKMKQYYIDLEKQIQKTAKTNQDGLNLKSGKTQLDNRISTFLNNNSKLSTDFRDKLLNLQSTVKNLDNISDLKIAKNSFRDLTSEAEKLGQTGDTAFTKLNKNVKQFLSFMGSATLVMAGVNSVRSLISTVSELDKSIVNLQQATGFSQPQAKALLNTYIEMGQQLGATGTEVANSADQWLRQGQSIADTNTLIKDSMILSKIGQIDSAQATQYLTSAMKGYKVEVSGVLGIIDKLSAIDVSSATSVGGLADAMSRTATGADLAGVSMDKLLGMLAVVGEVTQKSMDSVGESFKTIFARMGNVKLGQMVDEDGNDITTEINDVEKILNKVDIKLRDSATEFRNFGSVLDDVGNNWNNFSGVEQNAIANAFAGVRQRENFTVLMENYSTSLKYAGISAQSSGNAMKKFSATEEGVEAKTKKVQASLQELSQDTLNSGVIKGFLDLSNVLVNATDKIGLFNVVLIATAGILNAKTGTVAIGWITKLTDKIIGATGASTTLGLTLSAMIPVAAIIAGVAGVVKLYDTLNVTSSELAESHSKSIEKVQDLASEYDNLTGTLEDLEDQQKTVQEKLKDLYDLRKNQTITDAESQYLTQLESQNKKLEKQIEYEKVLKGIAGKKAEDAAVETLGEKTQSSIYTSTDKYGKQTAPLITDSEKVKENTVQIKALNQEIQNYNDVIGGIKLPEEQQAKYNKQLDYYNKALKDGLISEEQYNTYTKETKALLDGTLSYEDYAKKIEELKSKQSDYISENSTLVDSLQSVNDKIVSTSGANYDLKVSNQAIIDEAKKSVTAFGELENALDSEKNSAKDAFEPTIKSLSDIITSLDNVSKAMGSLDSAYAKLKSKDRLDMSDITALQESFGNTNGFEKFITTATSAKSVTSDVQNAFDNLVTTYVNTSGVLDGLNDSNKDMIASQLELMGVTNAESIVAERLAQQKLILADTGVDVSNATAGEITSLLDEIDVSDDTRLALVDLATQKLGVNDVTLSTSGDIQNLLSLMAVSNAACESLSLLEKIKSGEVKGYGINPEFLTNLTKKAQEEVDAFYKGLGGSSSNVTYSGGDKTHSDKTKSDKSSKSSSSDDPFLNAYNAEKATLDHKLAMDEITEKQYYDKLEKLNNKYFKKHQKKYLEQYRQNQEEIHQGRKKIDEDAIKSQFDDNENAFNLGKKTEDEYYKTLDDLNEKYYKNNTDYADEYQSNLEKIYQHDQEKLKEAYQKKVETIDKIISKYSDLRDAINNTAEGQSGDAQILTYTEGIKSANKEIKYLENEIDKLNKKKITSTFTQEDYESQLANLQSALSDAYSFIDEFNQSISESLQNSLDDLTNAYEDNYDNMTKSLEKQKDDYADIINAQKDILQLKKDQADYEKTIADKTKDISSIESRKIELEKAANTGDREANAELQKLNEDLASKKEDLADTQSDHELDLANDALDKALDDNNKILDTKLSALQTEYETQKKNQEELYKQLIDLTSKASSYTVEAYGTALDSIVAKMSENGIKLDGNYVDDLKNAQAKSSTATSVYSVLSRANGKGSASSDLNKYVQEQGYHQLSYENMAELASIFGINGVTAENIKDDTITKNIIKQKLEEILGNSTFAQTGKVSATPNGLLSGLGEHGLVAVRDSEIILDQADSKIFENFVGRLPALDKMFGNLTAIPNLSNIVTNNTNSSPTIQVILPANTTIDNSAINNYRKFIPELTNAVSEQLMNVQRQYR